MFKIGRRSKVFLVLLCIAVVAMRVSGAHLHLCFDGSEPPASVHLDHDAGLHHLGDDPGNHVATEHAGFEHADVDVTLIADALIKKSNSGIELLDLFAALLMLLSLWLPHVRRGNEFDSSASAFVTRYFLRPPLRGPPLIP